MRIDGLVTMPSRASVVVQPLGVIFFYFEEEKKRERKRWDVEAASSKSNMSDRTERELSERARELFGRVVKIAVFF